MSDSEQKMTPEQSNGIRSTLCEALFKEEFSEEEARNILNNKGELLPRVVQALKFCAKDRTPPDKFILDEGREDARVIKVIKVLPEGVEPYKDLIFDRASELNLRQGLDDKKYVVARQKQIPIAFANIGAIFLFPNMDEMPNGGGTLVECVKYISERYEGFVHYYSKMQDADKFFFLIPEED